MFVAVRKRACILSETRRLQKNVVKKIASAREDSATPSPKILERFVE